MFQEYKAARKRLYELKLKYVYLIEQNNHINQKYRLEREHTLHGIINDYHQGYTKKHKLHPLV